MIDAQRAHDMVVNSGEAKREWFMADLSDEYLTTRELAELLRIKERKVYDLAASGAVPCTRAFGKLLFQRAAIDMWLADNETGGDTAPRNVPDVFLGSHDPLLDWALRQSGAGIATYFDGSLDGIERLAEGDGIAAGLHLYDAESDDWNKATIEARLSGAPVVLMEWAWRQRGLIVDAGNPNGITSVADLKGMKLAPRQRQAGSQVLLEHLLAAEDLKADDVVVSEPARTETDAALAVMEGQADAAFGLQSVAEQFRLDFVPVMRERYDLLIWRKHWFEPAFQTFLAFTRSQAFAEKAQSLAGYDVGGLGTIHFNAERP